MNLVALAQRIGRLRKERQLTLQQIADLTGLTKSMLSKIENFRITPSLQSLGSIAAALGVTTAELLDGLDDKPSVVVLKERERLLMRRDYPQSSLIYQALAHTRPNKLMEPFIVEVPVGSMKRAPLSHEGEEFFIVLQGNIDYEYNDKLFHLQEGDAVYADGNTKHRLVNTGALPAKALIVFAKQ
jgi:transcriptional regulator with XRE-family HTH domain